ncbi:MAG: MarR family winged helix-turn-helix transcriptional regulator [Hyphomonadaceae bacterium]
MAAAITGLIEEIVQAYHRLTRASDQLHAKLGLTTGMRSVLLTLENGPPLTISAIAVQRSVSRQFMQRLVQDMVGGGWLSLEINPEDRRVSLVAPTAKARRAIVKLRKVETPLFSELQSHFSQADLTRATDVLKRINVLLSA